jgi:hypothetical protein
MVNHEQLTYLMQLLDDRNPVVQEALAREFFAYGRALLPDLARLPQPPDEEALGRIRLLIAGEGRNVLRSAWEAWMAEGGDSPERLERALSLIAEFQNGAGYEPTLGALLDRLADEFRLRGGTMDEETLARFLFKEKGIEGDRSNYYHPHNSNLVYVIEARRGLPISLACIYMLVGHRLGFRIGGCNWPNHFYARVMIRHKLILVDCFNGGRMMDREAFLKVQGPSKDAAESIVDEAASVDAIIARVLGNLVRAYQQISHEANSRLMLELLRDMERHFGARR